MSVADDPVRVEVDSGQVWVNGKLCAEVGAGVTEGRDELTQQLTLHRIAGIVQDRLDAAVKALTALDKQADRDAVGAGLADGLAGHTRSYEDLSGSSAHEAELLPPTPRRHDREFREGYDVGRTLAAMHWHLSREDPS